MTTVSPDKSTGVRVRPSVQQHPDHRRRAVQAGQPERCHTKLIRRIDVSFGANQQLGTFESIPMARPMKGSRAILLGLVNVGSLLEESAHGVPVGSPSRTHKR